MSEKKSNAWNEDTVFNSKCSRCGEFFLVDVQGKPVEPHKCPGVKQWNER